MRTFLLEGGAAVSYSMIMHGRTIILVSIKEEGRRMFAGIPDLWNWKQ